MIINLQKKYLKKLHKNANIKVQSTQTPNF